MKTHYFLLLTLTCLSFSVHASQTTRPSTPTSHSQSINELEMSTVQADTSPETPVNQTQPAAPQYNELGTDLFELPEAEAYARRKKIKRIAKIIGATAVLGFFGGLISCLIQGLITPGHQCDFFGIKPTYSQVPSLLDYCPPIFHNESSTAYSTNTDIPNSLSLNESCFSYYTHYNGYFYDGLKNNEIVQEDFDCRAPLFCPTNKTIASVAHEQYKKVASELDAELKTDKSFASYTDLAVTIYAAPSSSPVCKENSCTQYISPVPANTTGMTNKQRVAAYAFGNTSAPKNTKISSALARLQKKQTNYRKPPYKHAKYKGQ